MDINFPGISKADIDYAVECLEVGESQVNDMDIISRRAVLTASSGGSSIPRLPCAGISGSIAPLPNARCSIL